MKKANKEESMSNQSRMEGLLQCLVQVIGRAAIPEEKVREIVGKGGKQIKAFNLCDGTLTQSQIAKKCSLDAGNFSRTIARWIESGIVFPLSEGHEIGLLRVYPLAVNARGGGKKAARRKGK